MEIEFDHGSTLDDPLAAFANDYHWRSTKAKKQLRDRFGRWISLGANVRFRADGKEQAGTVTSVVDGKAYVDQKNRDGSVTKQILDANEIRVLASKATLPQDSSKIYDEKNNFANAIKNPAFAAALDKEGRAAIEREDGYALMAELEYFPKPEDKDLSNPVLFQLFAPGGRSLGKYTEAAVGDFDAMVEDNKAGGSEGGQQADTAPTGGGEAAPAAGVVASGEERPFRVPETVRNEIQATLTAFSSELPEADLAVATRLANDSTVSLADVQWVHAFFCDNDVTERLHGGYKGRKWASKIVAPTDKELFANEEAEIEAHPKYTFDDDTFAYFAVGQYAGTTIVNRLISVDYETGAVYEWTAEGFVLIPDLDMAEVDEPQIIPIDEMTADEFAHWLDNGTGEEFDILDTHPEERNLYTMAEAELDFDELDRAYSIIASGEGDGVYTPLERSGNAKKQGRGAGGRFGSSPDKAEAPAEEAKPKTQKARLPVALPLVANPAARISEWLSTAAEAPVLAAGDPAPVEEAPAPAEGYSEEDQAIEDAATGPTDEAIYFAIVDEIDKTAVLDAIAIVKKGGQPEAWLRSGGQWTLSPDTLTLLQGSTPPAVVELPDAETVKNVITQIDQHDAQAAPEEPAANPAPVAASGYAMPDGSYTIIDVEDLHEAVIASAGSADLFVKAHIRKRARALNRMDVVPAEWREFTLAEIGELSASQSVYGEFGEIIVASGVPGVADTPSDFKNVAKLQAYWTTGKGALKIRWGTPGDLTRAHRHLSKYVGPQRAWGLAQKYHRSLFGVYNHTHDVATGQYRPRRKR